MGTPRLLPNTPTVDPEKDDEDVTDVTELKLRTLWRGRFQIGKATQTFFFRSLIDITQATIEAQRIVDSHRSTRMAGAVLIGIEKEGHLSRPPLAAFIAIVVAASILVILEALVAHWSKKKSADGPTRPLVATLDDKSFVTIPANGVDPARKVKVLPIIFADGFRATVEELGVAFAVDDFGRVLYLIHRENGGAHYMTPEQWFGMSHGARIS